MNVAMPCRASRRAARGSNATSRVRRNRGVHLSYCRRPGGVSNVRDRGNLPFCSREGNGYWRRA